MGFKLGFIGVNALCRSSHPELFLRKVVLEICSKFIGEHPCRSVISIKMLCSIIKIALRHGCSPVNLLHILGNPFPMNTSGWLLLQLDEGLGLIFQSKGLRLHYV